jgi:hypothetical protein
VGDSESDSTEGTSYEGNLVVLSELRGSYLEMRLFSRAERRYMDRYI